jgi:hypothetical protein
MMKRRKECVEHLVHNLHNRMPRRGIQNLIMVRRSWRCRCPKDGRYSRPMPVRLLTEIVAAIHRAQTLAVGVVSGRVDGSSR